MKSLKPIVNSLLVAGSLTLALQAAGWADATITPDQLETKVKAYLAETTPMETPDTTLHVELLWKPHQAITLRGEDLQVLLSDNRRIPLTSRSIVSVTLNTEVENRRLGIPVRLSVEKPVWVATRLIRAKDPIKPGDVVLKRMHLAEDSFYALTGEEHVTQYTSRINIPPGAYLDTRQVVMTPSIYRNDDVYVMLMMPNGVNIKIIGKALEDGIIGKRIRVSQKQANNKLKTYVGEVTTKNTVIVKI